MYLKYEGERRQATILKSAQNVHKYECFLENQAVMLLRRFFYMYSSKRGF